MSYLVKRLQLVTKQPFQFTTRCIVTSIHQRGIEEFFPPGVYEGQNYVEENPVVGRRWKVSELRIRSNSDLHKFWYVLLKERNMLMTLDHECKRLGTIVPGATRLHKVKKTMELVEFVIKEREKAIMDLERERKYNFDEKNPTDIPSQKVDEEELNVEEEKQMTNSNI